MSDPEIGGVLAGHLGARCVRTYIKDTLMKPYARARMSDVTSVLHAAGPAPETSVAESYERPHGVRLVSGEILCWGKADDWKFVVLAAHERAFGKRASIRGIVLLPPLTRFLAEQNRAAVEDACLKLCVQQLAWSDPHHQLDHSFAQSNLPGGRHLELLHFQ